MKAVRTTKKQENRSAGGLQDVTRRGGGPEKLKGEPGRKGGYPAPASMSRSCPTSSTGGNHLKRGGLGLKGPRSGINKKSTEGRVFGKGGNQGDGIGPGLHVIFVEKRTGIRIKF